ncbi:hypothetical protein JTT01_11840 [Clostridium botulinum]|nr:hypothetical protein [Clostridium botulinum]
MNLTDRQEALNKATEYLYKNLINHMKCKPSSDMKEQTFKFIIKEKTWIAEDMKILVKVLLS